MCALHTYQVLVKSIVICKNIIINNDYNFIYYSLFSEINYLAFISFDTKQAVPTTALSPMTAAPRPATHYIDN